MDRRYLDLIEKYTRALGLEKKKDKRISQLRLFCAALILLAVVLGFTQGFSRLIFAGIAFSILANFSLWIWQSKVEERCARLEGLIGICQRYLDRISGNWSHFSDQGQEFADPTHPYSYDLDLFGKQSLFQYLNAAGTFHGRRSFADDLSNPHYDSAEIRDRQNAQDELAGLHDFAHQFQYLTGCIENREHLPELLSYMKDLRSISKNLRLKSILFYLPAVTAPLVMAGLLLFKDTALTAAALLILLVQAALWILFMPRTNRALAFTGKVKYGLSGYQKLFRCLEEQEFQGPLLKKYKEEIVLSDRSASKALKALDRIIMRSEFRTNTILYFILNIFFLWDIHCAFLLEKWQLEYSPHMDLWFESLGNVESLMSFSILQNVTDHLCLPDPVKSDMKLQVSSAGHPLIHSSVRVCNDFHMKESINIISGSNMSGKTTFMRTLAVNLVLASAGCRVCAESFVFPQSKLITSMRISDDLSGGVSTFYAELKKIKAILTMAEQEKEVLFFIDEIFRGTNSRDRSAGAKRVIQRLYQLDACGFLTTHDLSLCEADNHVPIRNLHFSESFHDGNIHFDYKMKEGVAESTNAAYLMELIGI